jgi:hypothetical protein
MIYTVVLERLKMNGELEVRTELLLSVYDESEALQQALEQFSSDGAVRIICLVKGDHCGSTVLPSCSAA